MSIQGYIYVIRSNQTSKYYLGSTIQKISYRLTQHKLSYKNYCNNQKSTYCTSFEILQHEDAYIELLNEVYINSKEELLKMESIYFDDLKDFLVNKNRPIDEDNDRREKQKKYQHIYRNGSSIKHEIFCPCCNEIIILKVSPKIK